MSYAENPSRIGLGAAAAYAGVNERADFITKTYLHLAAAVAGFIALEAVLLNTPGIERLVEVMVTGKYAWLIVLGAFMGVATLADYWARNAASMVMQYAGLMLYVVAQAVIFVPMLYFVIWSGNGDLIPSAALITGVLFVGLTAIVLFTRKDFSFLRGILMFSGFAALALIVVSILMGFNLGVWFMGAMIALACGYILYDTSNVLHHYRIGQHVAAALALFAAVALLFWYVLQLLMSLRRD
jgi:FtsH-binding integral membrane protein